MKDSLGRENRRLPDYICPECEQVFRPLRAASRYCSRPCARKKNGGHNRKDEVWWVNRKGYIEGKVWVDGEQRRVKQHRYRLEQHLGRPLEADEDAHHINGDKQDNRPENLRLMSKGDHARHHNSERTYQRGYKLNLTDEQRAARAQRMSEMRRSGRIKR